MGGQDLNIISTSRVRSELGNLGLREVHALIRWLEYGITPYLDRNRAAKEYLSWLSANCWSCRTAPALISRENAELFQFATPRFAFRIRTMIGESNCMINTRKLGSFCSNRSSWATPNTGKIRYGKYITYKPTRRNPSMYISKSTCIADSVLPIPKRFRSYHLLKDRYEKEYGEPENLEGLPYVRNIEMSGVCSQACCFMAGLILKRYAEKLYGITEITRLAHLHLVDGHLPLVGLEPYQMRDYFMEIGLRGENQIFSNQTQFANALRSYLQSGFPVILFLDLGRMTGVRSDKIDCDLIGLEGSIYGTNMVAQMHADVTRQEVRSRRHCVIAVGIKGDQVIIHDPSTYPYLKASVTQLRDASCYFNPSKRDSIVKFAIMAVVPNRVQLGLTDLTVKFRSQSNHGILVLQQRLLRRSLSAPKLDSIRWHLLDNSDGKTPFYEVLGNKVDPSVARYLEGIKIWLWIGIGDRQAYIWNAEIAHTEENANDLKKFFLAQLVKGYDDFWCACENSMRSIESFSICAWMDFTQCNSNDGNAIESRWLYYERAKPLTDFLGDHICGEWTDLFDSLQPIWFEHQERKGVLICWGRISATEQIRPLAGFTKTLGEWHCVNRTLEDVAFPTKPLNFHRKHQRPKKGILRPSLITSYTTSGLDHSIELLPDSVEGIDIYAFMQPDFVNISSIKSAVRDFQIRAPYHLRNIVRRIPISITTDSFMSKKKFSRVGRKGLRIGKFQFSFTRKEMSCIPPRNRLPPTKSLAELGLSKKARDTFGNSIQKTLNGTIGHSVAAIATFIPDISSSNECKREDAVKALLGVIRLVDRMPTELKLNDRTVIEIVGGSLLNGIWPGTFTDTDSKIYDSRVYIAKVRRFPEALSSLMKSLEEIAEEARKAKVILALELEPGPLYVLGNMADLETTCQYISMNDRLKDVVGVNLDIAHWAFLENVAPEKVPELVRDRIVHAHISDHAPGGHFGDSELFTFHEVAIFEKWICFLENIFLRNDRNALPYSGFVSTEMEVAANTSMVASAVAKLNSIIS